MSFCQRLSPNTPDNENLSISFISNLLSMSTRSLQMHLNNEGTTFSQLLLTTRKELAKKKWYGLTPKEYKKLLHK